MKIATTIFSLLLAFASCAAQEKRDEVTPLLDEAFELLEKTDVTPDRKMTVGKMYSGLGELYARSGNREKSIEALRKSTDFIQTQFKPSVEAFVDERIRLYQDRKEPVDHAREITEREFQIAFAEKRLRDAEKLSDPGMKLSKLGQVAKTLLELKQYDQVEKILAALPMAEKSYPKVAFPLLCQLRNVYMDSGEKEKAEALHAQCSELLPKLPQNTPGEQRDYATALIHFGETEKALKLLETFDSDSFEAQRFLETIILETNRSGNTDSALELTKRIQSFSDTQRDIEIKKILVKMIERQIERNDIQAIGKTLAAMPENKALRPYNPYRVYCLVAKKKESLGDHEGAVKAMEKAVGHAGEDEDERAWVQSQYWLFLADAMCALKMQEEAVTNLREIQEKLFAEYDKITADPEQSEALRTGPHRIVWVLDVFAVAQFRAGDSEGGEKTLRKMRELVQANRPNEEESKRPEMLEVHAAALGMVVKSFVREGMVDEALKLAEAVEAPIPRADVLIFIAKAKTSPRPMSHEVYDSMIQSSLSSAL